MSAKQVILIFRHPLLKLRAGVEGGGEVGEEFNMVYRCALKRCVCVTVYVDGITIECLLCALLSPQLLRNHTVDLGGREGHATSFPFALKNAWRTARGKVSALK